MNKKNLFLRSLYDFANSVVFINFLVYFGKWIVIDGGLSDFWYNALFAITTILLLFSAPMLAAYTDKQGKRKLLLNISTIVLAVSYSLCAYFAFLGPDYMPYIVWSFLLGQYCYQLCFVFYTPMILDVADEKDRTRASGIGQFANSLGQLIGLAITLPLSSSPLKPLLPSILIFIVLALPMMIWFKESNTFIKGNTGQYIKEEYRLFRKKIILFFTTSIASPVLIAFFFFSDAMVTVTNNYSIFLERVFAISDTNKSILLMLVLVMSALGGLIVGWIGHRISQLKMLKIILIGWIIALPLLAIVPKFWMFAGVTILVGLLIGSVYAVTRAYLSTVLKKEEMWYGFSFYTLTERFATLLGPLSRGIIIWLLGTKPAAYRFAMVFMVVFVVIGLGILIIKKPKNITQ